MSEITMKISDVRIRGGEFRLFSPNEMLPAPVAGESPKTELTVQCLYDMIGVKGDVFASGSATNAIGASHTGIKLSIATMAAFKAFYVQLQEDIKDALGGGSEEKSDSKGLAQLLASR